MTNFLIVENYSSFTYLFLHTLVLFYHLLFINYFINFFFSSLRFLFSVFYNFHPEKSYEISPDPLNPRSQFFPPLDKQTTRYDFLLKSFCISRSRELLCSPEVWKKPLTFCFLSSAIFLVGWSEIGDALDRAHLQLVTFTVVW